MRYKFTYEDCATDEAGTIATHTSSIDSEDKDLVLGAYYTSKADLHQNYDECEQKGENEWLFVTTEETVHTYARIKLEKYED